MYLNSMKKNLLLCLFIFAKMQAQDASQFTFAPGSNIDSYKFARSQPDDFGFEPVELSRADYTLRLTWCYNSVILYKSNGNFFGWAKTYITDNEDRNTTFGITFAIHPDTAKALIALADSTKISQIPPDNLIKGWPEGFDGVGYTIEEKQNGSYSYKTYWSPGSQKLAEAQIIATFVERFESISNFHGLTFAVYSQRPFMYYGVGCGVAGTGLHTKKEAEQFEQRRQNYLRNKEREAALKTKNK